MEDIEVGYQAFTADGDEEFGAIRDVTDDTLTIYVETRATSSCRVTRSRPCMRRR